MTDFAKARTMMVDCQVRPSDVTRYPIIDAMLHVRREEFVPPALRPVAYAGEHVPLAPGRVLLDARVFAKMLDALEVGPSDLVLDVGCGLGYSAAVLAHMAEAVIAIESDPAMAAEAAEILAREGADNAVVTEAPLAGGDAPHGPFDVIIIEGGVEQLPETLTAQLKEGGRIAAIFVSGTAGQVRIGVKSATGIAWRHAFDATAPVLEGFEKAPSFQF
ncbi:protein-L-isoaspartate O-methyltransferase [Halovulum dunhuangense]|uniref:Protein-L-isoaspartate O-methyltransferase n=1 Tax=Halovulum dunhuangense TaxID=1505036 RepID=A0A849L4K1_9RHOB|nr:protein-L-isoaspartate O-methyltransferase [Halovulum dunhuangense]NNU81358.1 protein-L-isoaspartate O-methyltransferase [Halovulum dunhuangense]